MFSTSAYLQTLEYRTLFPKWRALKYIRQTDSTGTDQGPFFTIITPEAALDQFGRNQENVCYVAGNAIQIRASTEFQYIFLGRYDNPDITEAGYNSWIALDHPYAIVFEAAATVFKAIGDTEKFAAYTSLAAVQAAEVRMSNIQSYGY